MNADSRQLSVGIVGLGVMGSPISANIVKGGFSVCGYDIRKEKIDALVAHGGMAAMSPREVAERADVVLISLPSLSAFETVIWGEEGILSSGRSGLVVMEISTLGAEDKLKAHHDLQARKMVMLDCPISGGARAAEKDLVVYGSGDQKVYESCLPIVEAFARSNYYLGAFGNGTKMKLVANLLVAIHNVSTAEAMVFGMKSGLDPELIYKIMCDSSGRSRMFEVRGARMLRDHYDDATMPVKTFQKDLRIIENAAAGISCPTPLFSNCLQVYLGAMAKGLAEQDTASVCAVLEDWANFTRGKKK